MSDKFNNLRAATRDCIEQLGASRDEELFEFRMHSNRYCGEPVPGRI